MDASWPAEVALEERAWREAAEQHHQQQEAYLKLLCSSAKYIGTALPVKSQQTCEVQVQRAREAHAETLGSTVEREADLRYILSQCATTERRKLEVQLRGMKYRHSVELHILCSQLEDAEETGIEVALKLEHLGVRQSPPLPDTPHPLPHTSSG